MATVITHALVAGATSIFAPQKASSYGPKFSSVPRLRLIISFILLAVIPDLDSIGFRYVFLIAMSSVTEVLHTLFCFLLLRHFASD
ncbi:hypothetical protein [Aurantivibrio infirmus]